MFQGISAAEVSERFGDRIRNAPAVVNAGRNKSTKQAHSTSGAGAGAGAAHARAHAHTGGLAITNHSSSNKGCIAKTASGNDDCCAAISNGGGGATMNGGVMTDNNGGGAATLTGGVSTSINGGGSPTRNGAETTTKGYAATSSINHGATMTKTGGDAGGGGGGEEDGTAATRSAGTGLYQPRTSGRSVGGSLRKRFSDDQVSGCPVRCALFAVLRSFGVLGVVGWVANHSLCPRFRVGGAGNIIWCCYQEELIMRMPCTHTPSTPVIPRQQQG